MPRRGIRVFISAFGSIAELKARVADLISLVNAALLLSHGLRRNVVLIVLMVREGLVMKVVGSGLRQYRPDYASAKGLLLKALRRGRVPGIVVGEYGGLKHLVKGIAYEVSYSSGIPLRYVTFSRGVDYTFILPSCAKLLDSEEVRGPKKVMLPRQYPEDQAVVILNNHLDRCRC